MTKFDNSWTVKQMALRSSANSFAGSLAEPSPKVTSRPREELEPKSARIIRDMWFEHVGRFIGHDTHQDMVEHLRREGLDSGVQPCAIAVNSNKERRFQYMDAQISKATPQTGAISAV